MSTIRGIVEDMPPSYKVTKQWHTASGKSSYPSKVQPKQKVSSQEASLV